MNWALEVRLYASSFVDKARKGFCSYARVGQSNEWFQVAKPDNELDLKSVDLQLPILNLNVGEQLHVLFVMPQ